MIGSRRATTPRHEKAPPGLTRERMILREQEERLSALQQQKRDTVPRLLWIVKMMNLRFPKPV